MDRGQPDEVAAAAARAGLNFIVLTDHGDGTRTPEPPQYRSGVLVIDGVELSTQGGHYIAIGMSAGAVSASRRSARRRRGREAPWRIRRSSLIPIPRNRRLRWHAWDAPFDAIEWLNADTEWRDEGRGQVLRALARYPFRPAADAGLAARSSRLERWNAGTH